MIIKNTVKSPVDLRRLATTLFSVKNQQLKGEKKTHEES